MLLNLSFTPFTMDVIITKIPFLILFHKLDIVSFMLVKIFVIAPFVELNVFTIPLYIPEIALLTVFFIVSQIP